MPNTDQEVFDHFRTVSGENFEIGLMAYARYAQDKYNWVNHRLARDNAPTDDEITGWIIDQHNARLDEIYRGAITQFQAAAEEYMKSRIAEERAKAVDSSILDRVDTAAKRVERATSFWRNLVPNVIVTVAASFVFSVIVLFAAAIYRGDPSIFALFKEPSAQTQPGAARP